jgi:hypothetical protein
MTSKDLHEQLTVAQRHLAVAIDRLHITIDLFRAHEEELKLAKPPEPQLELELGNVTSKRPTSPT